MANPTWVYNPATYNIEKFLASDHSADDIYSKIRRIEYDAAYVGGNKSAVKNDSVRAEHRNGYFPNYNEQLKQTAINGDTEWHKALIDLVKLTDKYNVQLNIEIQKRYSEKKRIELEWAMMPDHDPRRNELMRIIQSNNQRTCMHETEDLYYYCDYSSRCFKCKHCGSYYDNPNYRN